MEIGKRIKQLRVKSNLTLEELASRTELTKGYLSQLERNLALPSIPTLEDITEALGTTMAQFFAEEADEKIVFTRDDVFVDEQEDKTIQWIVPNAQKDVMEPLLLELKPSARSFTVDPHEGEEFGYVISGKVMLYCGEDSKGMAVGKGESFYIRGNQSHYLQNCAKKNAVVLWVSTPPVF